MGKFRVRVKPNAKNDEVSIMGDGTIKISIKAPPKEGKANKYLIKFLSTYTGIHTENIRIISGQHSKNKVIEIKGIGKIPFPNNV